MKKANDNVASKAFKDTSIFQGYVQFEDEFGVEYRAEWTGINWMIYVKGEEAFILRGRAPTKSKKPKAIYESWARSDDFYEYF